MSRVIVKNLPSQITSDKLHNVFSAKGQITNLQLKYTKNGVFRRFAFVGYKTEEEANEAIKYFNDTYYESSKIKVEICRDLGDPNRPRPWSKYSENSSANQRVLEKHKKKETNQDGDKKEKSKDKKKMKHKESVADNLMKEVEKDSQFLEFLEVHKSSAKKPLWSNDAADFLVQKSPKSASDIEAETSDKEEKCSDAEKDDSKASLHKHTSAMEFLKTKIVKSTKDDEDSGVISDSGDNDCTNRSKSKVKKLKKSKNNVEKSTDSDASSDAEDKERDKKIKSKAFSNEKKEEDEDKTHKNVNMFSNEFTVKARNLPYTCKKKDIKKFFFPLKPVSLRMPPMLKGFAYVKFGSEKEMKQALVKHRGFLGGRRIDVVHYNKKETAVNKEDWKSKFSSDVPPEESLAESGRIFVRNLSYTVCEEDLEKLFTKYGPVSEILLPIDSFTKKLKGFAFISFMFPEHAVKAFSDLDGSTFQGRILHLLPSKQKKTQEELDDKGGGTYKQKKMAKQKETSGSSHNWNTLFLGANAVADVMAERYKITKAKLLDAESRDSVGVRMALVETQLVTETKDFLIENGVCLDSFEQPGKERSKTTLLVKNLPANTQSEILKEVFEKYGLVSRIVLPPSGITAVIEFQEPTEAKAAFKHLAYTKFQHVPLYLEWAPVNIFSSAQQSVAKNAAEIQENSPDDETAKQQNSKIKEKEEQLLKESEGEEIEPEPNSTLFVKNLNFETTDESLKQHFQNYGKIHAVSVAKKKDLKNPGKFLSMGYGFVQFKEKKSAQTALKELQHSQLDGHSLELKLSNRETVHDSNNRRKETKVSKDPKTTKIHVRNIPFEATAKEVKELFAVFGELKAVRLPKKMSGTGSHRGFGFVDFLTRNDAERALKALSQSTHLFGRRLVLEWAEAEDDAVEVLRRKTAEQYSEGPPSKRVKKSALMKELLVSGE